MQGFVRLCVELFRDPLNAPTVRDQEFVIMASPEEIREVLPGVRCMGASVRDCTIPFNVVDKDGKQIALLPPTEADPIHAKSFMTLEEQMADTCVSGSEELEKMRASIPRVFYPVMLYDTPALIRLTLTHMDTGDELWSGTFVLQNPCTVKKEEVKTEPSSSSMDSSDIKVKMEDGVVTNQYVPEPYLYEGQPEIVHITLWNNLQHPPGLNGSNAEGQISLALQRVCNADTGKPLAVYGGECSWAIKNFALATHSFRFGL